MLPIFFTRRFDKWNVIGTCSIYSILDPFNNDKKQKQIMYILQTGMV